MPRRPIFDEAWGERFTHAMRAHEEHLQRIVDADNDDLLDEDDPLYAVDRTTFTGQPFDGCQDCWEREMWSLAIALALQGAESGEVTLEEPDAPA